MRSCISSIIPPVFSVTWSSEIIIICWIDAQETFLISINAENSCAASYFLWKLWYILFFWILWWIKFKRTAFVWYRNVLIHYKCILINLMCLYWKKVLHSFKIQKDILQLYGNVIYDIYCSVLKVLFHMLRRHIIVTCVHLLGRWRYKFITYIKSP